MMFSKKKKKISKEGESIQKATISFQERKEILELFLSIFDDSIVELQEAIQKDYGIGEIEALSTEILNTRNQIQYLIKDFMRLLKPQKIKTSIQSYPSKGKLEYIPYGKVLIICSCYNAVFEPIRLLTESISAGNITYIKLSRKVPNISSYLLQMIEKINTEKIVGFLDPKIINNTEYDFLYFTGFSQNKDSILKYSNLNRIPKELILHEKSCIVFGKKTNLDLFCKRIAWSKMIHNGQCLTSYDTLIIPKYAKTQILEKLISSFKELCPNGIDASLLGKMISQDSFMRIVKHFVDGTIIYGGKYDANSLKIEPTIMINLNPESKLITEPIYGPILIVEIYENETELKKILQRYSWNSINLYSIDSEFAKDIIDLQLDANISINDTFIGDLNLISRNTICQFSTRHPKEWNDLYLFSKMRFVYEKYSKYEIIEKYHFFDETIDKEDIYKLMK